MTLQITGRTVANNAASGTLIGVVSVAPAHSGLTTFALQTDPNGYFVLSAKGELYVAWIGTAVVGNYPIMIHAHGSGWNEFGNFVVQIVAVPVGVNFSAPPDSVPLPGGRWRVTDPNGYILDVGP